jgi:hypothetical protein
VKRFPAWVIKSVGPFVLPVLVSNQSLSQKSEFDTSSYHFVITTLSIQAIFDKVERQSDEAKCKELTFWDRL